MSSDPLLDPSVMHFSPKDPVTMDPFANLPARNPERLLTLLRSSESMLSSAVQSFAGGGSAGLVAAGIAPLVPMLLEQAAGALATTDGDTIDDGLAAIADLCLRARSVHVPTAVEVAPGVYVAGAHNED